MMIALLLGLGAGFGRAQQTVQPADAPIPQAQWKEKGINPPVEINKVDPDFLDSVGTRHINYRCAASVTVDANGIPKNIQLIRCSDPLLVKGFMDWVAKFRYKPATTQEGKPVAVVSSESIFVKYPGDIDPGNLFHYGFGTPPGTTYSGPDASGVYPLTKFATKPILIKFQDEGYGDVAFPFVGSSPCDILLTINAKGNASDLQVIHCERPTLEKPAVDSLLKSKYKPGSVNGKAVAVRASIHIEYADAPVKP